MKKWKQILCLIGVIVLVGLYLITLIFSFTDHTQAKSWLSASLYATVIIPVFLYAFFLICRPLSDRKQKREQVLKNSNAAADVSSKTQGTSGADEAQDKADQALRSSGCISFATQKRNTGSTDAQFP